MSDIRTGRWKIWRGRDLKVKGVAITYRVSDIGLEVHTIGLTDEVAREEICQELCDILNPNWRMPRSVNRATEAVMEGRRE